MQAEYICASVMTGHVEVEFPAPDVVHVEFGHQNGFAGEVRSCEHLQKAAADTVVHIAARAPDSGSAPLDALRNLNPSASDNAIFYDAPTVMPVSLKEVLSEQLALDDVSRLHEDTLKEHADHERMLRQQQSPDHQWSDAANTVWNHIDTLFKALALGTINFGAFSLALNYVTGEILGKPKGFLAEPPQAQGWDATGKEVGVALVGGIPASAAYGLAHVASNVGVSPALTSALKIIANKDFQLVARDPATVYPRPRLFKVDGTPNDEYNQQLKAVMALRGELKQKQAAFASMGDASNYRPGMAFFSTLHGARQTIIQAMKQQSEPRYLGAGAATLAAGLTSGVANLGTQLAVLAQKMNAEVPVEQPDGSTVMVKIFVAKDVERDIKQEPKPTRADMVLQTFKNAWKSYQGGVNEHAKLSMGPIAAGLACFVATVPVTTIAPLVNKLTSVVKNNPQAALAIAFLGTCGAYATTYFGLSKGMVFANKVARENVDKQIQARINDGFMRAIEEFSQANPDIMTGLMEQGLEPSARMRETLFKLMNEKVLEGLEQAALTGLNSKLDPGVDQRVLESYVEQSGKIRQQLADATVAEETPPQERTAAHVVALEAMEGMFGAMGRQISQALQNVGEKVLAGSQALTDVNQRMTGQIQNAVFRPQDRISQRV